MLTRSPSRIPTSFQNIRRSQQQQHFSFCPLIFLQSSQQLMRAHKKLFHLFDIFSAVVDTLLASSPSSSTSFRLRLLPESEMKKNTTLEPSSSLISSFSIKLVCPANSCLTQRWEFCLRVRERYGERGREKESGEECERKRERTGREGANLFTLQNIKERAKFAQKTQDSC